MGGGIEGFWCQIPLQHVKISQGTSFESIPLDWQRFHKGQFFKSNVIYLNYIGCQDDLIFDGGTFVMNKKAEIIHQCEFFKESESIVNIEGSAS